MSVHPRNPDISTPSPSDTQGPRTIASFFPQGAPQAYRQPPHDQASMAQRTVLSHDHRVPSQPQASNYSNPYARELHLGHVSRHPSLSLDTRNLVPSSRRTPSPASATASLHADLTAFKLGLETLWSRSAHTLHTLHHALAIEREMHIRAQRGRELLATANARMWEDKVHLEGEKRELRARLDAQTAAMDARERAISNRSASEDVRVKTEDTEEEENVTVPVREVQRMIEERLRIQADQFARESNELYSKLAAAETRLIELEQQVGTTPVMAAGAPSPGTPHTGKQSSAQSDRDFALAIRQQQRHHEQQQGNHRSVSDPVVSRGPPPPYPLSTRHSAPQSTNQPRARANFPVVHSSQHPGAAHRVSQPPPQHPSQHLQPSQLPESFVTQYPALQRPPPPPSPPPPPPPPPPHAPMLTTTSSPVAPPQLRRAGPQSYSTGVRPPSRSSSPTFPPAPVTAPTFQPRPPATPGKSPRAPPRPVQPTNPQSAPPSHPSPDPHSTSPTHPPSNPRPGPPQNPPSPAPHHSPPSTPAVSRPPKRQRTSTFSHTPALPAQEMTADERRALGALGSVLAKKRDGDGWKCVLCRQEKKNPTATFGETTPIGVVADHVRGVHCLFWEKLPEP